MRLDASGRSGIPGNLWLVNVKRQGRLFHRSFFDNAYGGRDSAFTMAVAYRDALLRIFPPLTQLQQRVKIRSNNKSGMAGVSARYDDNRRRLKAWVATMDASGVTHQKYFSVKEHGEEKAKELAIAARKELLTLYRDNKFVTVNANATQAAESAFPALLNEGANQEGISPLSPMLRTTRMRTRPG
ncbi:AP2/ERF family transcription factor [Diaphorobacter aerolatus]|uniref:AP2/ERF family transcription factor n=1 Tax=Diaphorobacter aerolatus TaxID=1288495 RepID=UPI001D01206C|nr:AP2/ERF family transcription factor [Diaphorobacter aerolatus]